MTCLTSEKQYFTPEESLRIKELYSDILHEGKGALPADHIHAVRRIIDRAIRENVYRRDKYGINPTLRNLETARLLLERLGPDRSMMEAIMLYNICKNSQDIYACVRKDFDNDTVNLIEGLLKVSKLYERRAAVNNENFRNLLLTFAEDIRVILIMIVDRLALMRMINHHDNKQFVNDIAMESIYLYAPLAHRLGLYTIKSELEDMYLKYTDRETYSEIAHKLNETKRERDRYIANFIEPVKRRLEENGLKFDIKGRTKSIYSIWNKIKKQNIDVEHIYDLFAIRVIIDTIPEREKTDCWIAYSLIVDMYKSNPSRMKDWLTIPKSNGYESLHTTVYGPDNKWVEVQIRTRRMDEIAERGLAAHWKYKGGKAEQNLDKWMNNVRDLLETAELGPSQLIKGVKMDVYNKEVFVFTPKGDLHRLPLGATLLDFAFLIHSKIGCTCIGGKVDGRNQKINYKLKSGDTIEILTSSQQTPKQDWLSFVVTSKARNKIRQTLNEMANKQSDLGREILERRFKNRKIELDESLLMKATKKMGFKNLNDFFSEIGQEHIDVNDFIEQYLSLSAKDNAPEAELQSAENFEFNHTPEDDETKKDVLIIGDGNKIKGINYKLARCCNPIFGDDIVGFISSEGVIKIHRTDCPNVKHLRSRYAYRTIDTRWSGKMGSQYAVTLRVVGNDDIGIVTNISSIISKENRASLRNISIDSHDGLFQGYLVLGVSDINVLNNLIKKIKTVKGVKDVQRTN